VKLLYYIQLDVHYTYPQTYLLLNIQTEAINFHPSIHVDRNTKHILLQRSAIHLRPKPLPFSHTLHTPLYILSSIFSTVSLNPP
jgi:hypothetical protein